MLLVNKSIRLDYAVNLILLFFFTKLVILTLCKHNYTLQKSNILHYKNSNTFQVELYLRERKHKKCPTFIHLHNPYKKIDVNERQYKLNDDLRNIILLFGRIAEPYYPKTAEQFNFFKEPYSKYIHTNENKNSTKWKYIFKDKNKINKNIFYEKICELKFKWPINEDENITEYNFYNLVIEKCLNNINIVKNNIHNLKVFLTKVIESKKEFAKKGATQINPIEEKKLHFIHNLYNDLKKEFLNENDKVEQQQEEDEEEKCSDDSSSTKDDKLETDGRKILEKLEKFHLNDIFKQHNRSYSRLLLNEVFNKEYPSKKTTDIFLHLVFQKNVEEFSYEYFLKYLDKLGKKIELFTCNYNCNIHFDQFFFLMKNEFKKNSILLKKKKTCPPKISKAKKDYNNDTNKNLAAHKTKMRIIENRHNNIAQNGKKKKKQNSLIIEDHDIMTEHINKIQSDIKNEDPMHHIENLDNRQSNFLIPSNLENEKNINQTKKIHIHIHTNSQTVVENLKGTVIKLFNYIVNTIKNAF
ncbi:hypothetical protein, conserved [Plasmodium gonderi]|uniref:Uncharacterized protein n=1 Tax=Plasmodium gonderi TaxID=77519 RepID=A0A1Y1JDW8_PLAGO|nr:hypothetical protein, conserved [Plasmodium gonderi]GAW80450.1 hypothetical protein, conserved [Plasmodium gonderi]